MCIRDRGGFGFVRVAEGGDIFVGAAQLGGAFHGETVLVKIRKEGERNREGEVIRVLTPLPYRVTGTFEKTGNAAFVLCDNGITPDIYIPRQEFHGAKNGQKVLVGIYRRAVGNSAPKGSVQEAVSYTHLDVYKRQVIRRYAQRGRRGARPRAAAKCGEYKKANPVKQSAPA